MIRRYLYTVIINLILLPAFIFISDKTFIFYLGVFLFFVFGYFTPSDIKPKKITSIFLLASLPFIIITFIYAIGYNKPLQFSKEIYLIVLPFFLYYLLTIILGFIMGLLIQKKIKKPEWKHLIFISLVCFFIGTMSGAINWPFQFSIVGLVYSLGGFIIGSGDLKKNLKSYLILIAPFILIYTILSLINGSKQTYPISFIVPVGAITGICLKLLYLNNRKILFAFFSFLLLILLISGYFGMKNWLEYVFSEKHNNINITELKFNFRTETDGSLTENDIKNKICVFYFWSTSCGICFKKFPELEKLYQKYSDKNDIEIYSVNVNVTRNDLKINMYKKVRKLGYTFPVLVVPFGEKDSCRNNFGITAFPHSTIISKNGKVIHNGRFNNDPTIFINNMDKFIARLISD